MNIVHIGLAAYYTEGMTYQDNLLSEQNQRDGHVTTYISNAQCWKDGKIIDVEPCDKVLENGVRLIRLPYRSLGIWLLTEKVRAVKGLYALLSNLEPDIIFSHNLCYWSVQDIVRYKKQHPEVVLYADTHTDANNSGTNWLSLHVLHRAFYKCLVQHALLYIEKYFYVSEECKDFSLRNYKTPLEKMEFFPLGGTVPSDEERQKKRSRVRAELFLTDDDIFFLHSGKLDKLKKTADLLRAFSQVPSSRFHLIVVGSIGDDVQEELEPLIEQDPRVHFLGWKSGEELQDYLCACDMYLQPGSQSATMQNALCCGAPVMLYPHKSHKSYLKGNGFYVKNTDEMVSAFQTISQTPETLPPMRDKSLVIACRLLDYRKLAARLYQKE